ncbi:hypothetical protein Y886_13625 [Xanthomonas hyacinthi DSM 19077]|nr:hypothetical protein Y886_13625 [Xanthomonas hyacinthi DSM 19077]
MLLADQACNQPSIWQVPTAHRDVQAAGEDIDDLVLEVDVQFDVWKARRELRQLRHQQMQTDDLRNADA